MTGKRESAASGKKTVRDSEKTRRNILEAAVKLYAEKGVDGASIRDVANEAGENMGLVYYYFDDKEDLFNTALADAVMSAISGILKQEAITSGSAIKRLETLFVEYLKLPEENPMVALLGLRGLIRMAEQGEQMFSGIMKDRVLAVAGIVEEGIDSGELVKVDPTAFGFSFIALSFSFLVGTIASVVWADENMRETARKDYVDLFKKFLSGVSKE